MFRLKFFTVLCVCVASVITSSEKLGTKTDGNSGAGVAGLDPLSAGSGEKVNASPEVSRFSSNLGKDATIGSTANRSTPIITEAGSIDVTRNEMGVPTSSDEGRRKVARPKQTVVPRKGVGEPEPRNNTVQTSSVENVINTNVSKASADTLGGRVTAESVVVGKPTDDAEVLAITSSVEPPHARDESTSSSLPPSSVRPARKHKPKPEKLHVDGPDSNDPIPATPTKKPPFGVPTKIDYIVPLAISVTALPILGVVAFVLYRRGRDCWDKRHYSRMDFLVDGMYAD